MARPTTWWPSAYGRNSRAGWWPKSPRACSRCCAHAARSSGCCPRWSACGACPRAPSTTPRSTPARTCCWCWTWPRGCKPRWPCALPAWRMTWARAARPPTCCRAISAMRRAAPNCSNTWPSGCACPQTAAQPPTRWRASMATSIAATRCLPQRWCACWSAAMRCACHSALPTSCWPANAMRAGGGAIRAQQRHCRAGRRPGPGRPAGRGADPPGAGGSGGAVARQPMTPPPPLPLPLSLSLSTPTSTTPPSRERRGACPMPQLPPLTSSHALFLDFDGTLAELAPRPDAVTVAAGLIATLSALHIHLGGALAIVTGGPQSPLAPPCRPAIAPPGLASVVRAARELAVQHDGLLLEHKNAGLVLHYRQAPHPERLCHDTLARAIQAAQDLELQPGKCVLEVKPRGVHKGRAITDFMAWPPFAGRMPVFAGDDLADEAGFAAVQTLGGWGIKMGAGTSLAQHRRMTPAALRGWLSAARSHWERAI